MASRVAWVSMAPERPPEPADHLDERRRLDVERHERIGEPLDGDLVGLVLPAAVVRGMRARTASARPARRRAAAPQRRA